MTEQTVLDFGPGRRTTDPRTSQPNSHAERGRLAARIFRTHEEHPDGLTDDELCGFLPGEFGPSVKTCRSRLSKAGVLFDTGTTRVGDRGRAQIVWRIEVDR